MAVPTTSDVTRKTWAPTQAYVLALVFLAIGIVAGYLLRGSNRDSATVTTATTAPTSSAMNTVVRRDMPSLDELKRMADMKAQPLLDQLKAKPTDPAVLAEIAHTYLTAHQFQQAQSYYEKSLKADPRNVGVRADFASSLFYTGDVDKAIVNLEEALTYDPKNPQVLFNLGMMRKQAKGDTAGAVSLWQRLLDKNPTLASDRRQAVQKAIVDATEGPKHVAAR